MNRVTQNLHTGLLYVLPLLPIPAALLLPEECPYPSDQTVLVWCVLAAVAVVAGFRLVFIEKRRFRAFYLVLLVIYCFGICSNLAVALLNMHRQ